MHFLDFLFPQLDADDVDDLRESAFLVTFVDDGFSPAEVLDLLVGAIVGVKSVAKFSAKLYLLAFHSAADAPLVEMTDTRGHAMAVVGI